LAQYPVHRYRETNPVVHNFSYTTSKFSGQAVVVAKVN